VVVNDSLTLDGEQTGMLSMPAEFYVCKEKNLTFLAIQAGPAGSMRKFTDELKEFIKAQEFADVVVLSSTMSPVKRERDSNRQIPEVFAYVNNYFYKTEDGKNYYESNGMRKFGYWIEDVKKRPHQEMRELMGAGSADRLMKAFNRMDLNAVLFVIFTTGGIDFVGGFTLY
jgi:hypothetical protein